MSFPERRLRCPLAHCLDGRAALNNPTNFERQNISCAPNGGSGNHKNGSYSLSFRQESTPILSTNATVADLEEALEGLATIGDIEASAPYALVHRPRKSTAERTR